ncbi:CGNR zinc finger domain-containing protein [Streptomyces sp. NPDC048637]|uniref:CGNR zinc finger domain-containing protein n=1 Tax=Streptomyces sp. NPDC048637 TaxID=3155636 RepID=UPI00342F60C0
MVKYDPAPGEERSVAVALANTLRRGPTGEVDHLAPAHSVEGWVAGHRLATQPLRFSDHDVGRLTELRAAVRALFTAAIEESAPDSAALGTVNGAAAGAPGSAQLRWHPPSLRSEWKTTAPHTVDAVLACIASDAIDVLCGPRGTSLRQCAAHGCIRFFLREHARRQWCSTMCGDRVRAARHYQRRRDQT